MALLAFEVCARPSKIQGLQLNFKKTGEEG
jgi:hypothetical protein